MTPKQQAILDFIRDYPQQYPPTIREIAAGVGLSSSPTVHHHLTELVKRGFVKRNSKWPRCIAIKENRP